MDDILKLNSLEWDAIMAFHKDSIFSKTKEMEEYINRSILLSEEITQLEGRIEELQEMQIATSQLLLNKDKANDYSEIWPLHKKAEFVIRQTGAAMNTGAIADDIMLMDKNTTYIRSELVSNIGATLLQKVNKGDVFNRDLIGGIYYYGLKEWFSDNDGGLKEGRRIKDDLPNEI
jgi:hypothetical protein